MMHDANQSRHCNANYRPALNKIIKIRGSGGGTAEGEGEGGDKRRGALHDT